MKKPLCDWCSEREYDISVLNDEGGEELLCKVCYKEYQINREMPGQCLES